MIAALAPLLVLTGAGQSMPLDGFETLGAWQASASDGVKSSIKGVAGTTGQAMRLDYDFGAVAGYAYARRVLPIAFPANFEISLRIRGSGGVNDLQLKFVDASGANVWWYQRRNFRPSTMWQTIHIRSRDISFAWGPARDTRLAQTASVELVVVRGRDGGSGTIEIDDLRLAPLPPVAPPQQPRASDPRAIDGQRETAWAAKGGDALTIDLGGRRRLGGVSLHWTKGRGAARYRIDSSDDGKQWHTLRNVSDGDGGDDPIALPDTETRFLRLALPRGGERAALAELVVEPPEWAATPNAFIGSIAQQAPRGTFPRAFLGEQPYWTLAGSDGGAHSGLIGEDGEIEVAKGGFSIAPFVVADGKTFSWADVAVTQSLEDGYLPLPHVDWAGPRWRLDTMLAADQTAPRLLARWRLTNDGTTPKRLGLVLAVRPFQVNPPAQFLSQQGGVSAISAIRWRDGRLAVTTPPAIVGDAAVTRTLLALVAPSAAGTASFDQGALSRPAAPTGGPSLSDPSGLGSAALRWDVTLAPGASIDVPMAIPFEGSAAPLTRAGFDGAVAATRQIWAAKLGQVIMTVPPAKQAVADTVRTALAHILMSRDGPALKPGTRSYDRSWIRDGAMMADTLLRLGVADPARAFADWYSGKLFANGKVPCCVDYRGPDPVPENDAQGEYIHLLVQLYRFTGARARLESDWPRIEAALGYMEAQRQSERTPRNAAPGRRHLYGLMPPSISHEGYSSAPQYSLWDDFWALTGYKDAAYAAAVLGRPSAAMIAMQRDEFAGDIHAAIKASAVKFGIDFIPGAVSLGDFDATSTTIALDPAGEQAALDPAMLANTFQRQWQRVNARGAAGADWNDYTPYELRNVSAFVRLGWRDKANRLLDAYMADRRPPAWNGWAEVVGRKPREVRFIGDMPHAWVASDFIRSALDLFAYERGEDRTIVLGGGFTEEWLAGRGSAIRNLRTSVGTLGIAMRADTGTLSVEITGDARPAGGFVLPWPLSGAPGTATIDGRRVRFTHGELRIPANHRPINITVTRK